MLYVAPKMLGRPTGIESDLLGRRERAETEGWLGEVEGIELTRLAAKTQVDLGMPARTGRTK
ncbi:hypothetical protein ABIA33_003994 [Streptacidiphilus sp. MAP12-16]|uniref:recombinase n=1 Tax=Streptacidiphilus sp. MAP12-16 TaxID=3156300 RepID=UPI00351597E5